jgi:hypothetical protein
MGSSGTARVPLSEGELLQLRRWNTPTIYNGWEQITQHDASREGFNGDRVCDFMPQMGPMVGHAVTVETMIAAARGASGKSVAETLEDFAAAARRFSENAVAKFQRRGERGG